MANTRSAKPKAVAKKNVKSSKPTSSPKSKKGSKETKPTTADVAKTSTKTDIKEATETAKHFKKTSSVPSMIDSAVTAKAIGELAKFLKRQNEASASSEKKSLFDDEDDQTTDSNAVYVLFNTKKFYSDKIQFKPKVLSLRHPIYNRENIRTCLIVRDNLVSTSKEIEQLEAAKLPTVAQILPILVLKKDYKPFEKRRQLYREFDLFLVDDAVLNLMPSLLGKIFYSNGRKKPAHPIRVTQLTSPKELSIATIAGQVEKCLGSTFFLPPVSTNVVVKVGYMNAATTHQDLIENIEDVVSAFDANSLVSVMAKTTESPSLPLWYTEKLYEESDIADPDASNKNDAVADADAVFEQGLLELAGPSEVSQALGKTIKGSKTSTAQKTAQA